MVKRSLRASTVGIEQAKKAFQRKGWTQEYLAGEVGLETRQSVWKFFKGQPIERHIFIDICLSLDLDWQEIADLQLDSAPPAQKIAPIVQKLTVESDVDALVAQVRSLLDSPILAQCGTLRLLDIAYSIPLDDIYVNVSILEQLSCQQWLEVSDLQSATVNPFDRLGLTQSRQKKVPALDTSSLADAQRIISTYPKLMVMGKPGAGKTTFLQKVALQCIRGELPLPRIPIFIQLRNLAEETLGNNITTGDDFSLLDYINQKLNDFGISVQHVETLLKHGKVLILLDGLDEVRADHIDTLLKQITKFSETYYQNSFIITCRFAAQPYRFPGFTYVELADFDQTQIEAFAKKWFRTATSKPNEEKGLNLATQFIDKLKLPENQPIRELARTPILLNLTVSVFQAKADFPKKRSKLYEAGLDILLVRWDEARGIQRDEIYRNLSLPHKIKLLSHIAATTFEEGNYFFEQTEIEQHIADYLTTLPEANIDPETLRLNSEGVLKAIEAQHGLLVERALGVYSFSHLTFQEYLTARNIVASPDTATLREALQRLSTHIREPQWREVFLLTAGLLRNAELLLKLMKQQIDRLVAEDCQLQEFLAGISQKCYLLQTPYKPAAVRAFYFTLFLDRDLGLAVALDRNLARDLTPELALDLELARAFSLVQSLTHNPEIQQILALGFALNLERLLERESELGGKEKRALLSQCFQQLKEQLPDLGKGRDYSLQWWKAYGQVWAEQFHSMLIEYRHIGHGWQLTALQLQLLKQYYQANQLLVDCLNSDCRYSSTMRTDIEATLLKYEG
ncbi:NACHT domain-containing NTPase [Microcoleus sp. FACHB-53]|nr:NACHT domain-containing NTPase [Microcoleus sp. FACHB-53]